MGTCEGLADRRTEQLLTGDTASRVEAAAKAANPGGATIVRVETDAEGAAYEALIRKAISDREIGRLVQRQRHRSGQATLGAA